MKEVREIEVSNLKPWEDNPRINDHAVEHVAKSIQKFGFNVPILHDQNFTIIAGHTRWKAARQLGMTHVPAIMIAMDEVKRKAFFIADNKTAEIADWDDPKLREILRELAAEDIKLPDFGFMEEEVKRMMKEIWKRNGLDDDEIPEVQGAGEIQSGDLILLGDHRLLCGDSRDPTMVATLLNGEMVDHVFGGPPCFNQRGYAQWGDYQQNLADMRANPLYCKMIMTRWENFTEKKAEVVKCQAPSRSEGQGEEAESIRA
jgi:hypothetical protein